MTSPGRGRYTDYVAGSSHHSAKYNRLHKIFNFNSMTEDKGESRGALFGSTSTFRQNSIDGAAKEIVKDYIDVMTIDTEAVLVTEGLPDSPARYFNGNQIDKLPNTADTDSPSNSNKAGIPANSYVPNLRSPGASADGSININPTNIDTLEKKPVEIKPKFISGVNSPRSDFFGTRSPSDSSPVVGIISVGRNLSKGSSNKSST